MIMFILLSSGRFLNGAREKYSYSAPIFSKGVLLCAFTTIATAM